jgi:glycosyltransferase involved in cell wall biosynthesis
MDSKKSFVTIFTQTANVHLIKDVGQIPYFMYKTQGYDSTIVTYLNESEYPNLETEVKGLKIKFITPDGEIFGAEKAVLKYLWKEARNIDVLHLFHVKRENVLYLKLYKYLNPNGKTYVKIDINLPLFKEHKTWFSSRFPVKKQLLNALLKQHFKLTDLFSVETTEAKDFVPIVFPELKEKLIYIPNGANDVYIDNTLRLKSFTEKENIIITVGRIGSAEKNTKLFLDALLEVELEDWKVYLIGPVEKDFEPYIDQYFRTYPEMKSKIQFTGNISDRLELYEWYNRAKIFCLTSPSESGPMVFPEALYFGNYIITTDVGVAKDITRQGKYGAISPSTSQDFAGAIQKHLNSFVLTSDFNEKIKRFAKESFTWSAITADLSRHLDR